ncbi:MAG: hypothetical protein KF689_12255 [Gemmatimonadaceae bacterium]|nr:hypothetical protein [Gemmatimonadaceae bacterium]MCW5827247.1 hypothetical protein [Gemmatimonadaceae bacterium]
MEPAANHETLLLWHRLLGYPVVFVVAPLALATFAGRGKHRWAGIGYAVGMLLLYLSGSILTFTQYAYGSWEFGRNVVFNLMGLLFVLHGVRAIWLWRHPNAPRPTALDRSLRHAFTITLAVMLALAVFKNTPLRVFTVLGLLLWWQDRADWRAGFDRAALYARHARYILASYFYALTVASLVHLRDELGANARWLWPAALGVLAIWIANGAATPGHPWRRRIQPWAVAGVLAIATAFGAYALHEVRRDGLATLPSPPPEAVRRP